MKSALPLLVLLAGLLAAQRAAAVDPPGDQVERERIKSERAQVEAAFARRERACREHFVVTSCLDDARRDRREAMERLRQQQQVLDEAQRKQRAAQRMDDIRAKVAEEDAKRREATTHERRPDKPLADPSALPAPASQAARAASAESAHRTTASEARQRIAAQEQRLEEARRHREDVDRQNAERAKGKPPAQPLPVPSAPAASTAR